MLALSVCLFVLGRIEDRFGLLRRHSRHGFGSGRLIRTLRWGWTRRLALPATTTTSATATTAASSAFFLAQG